MILGQNVHIQFMKEKRFYIELPENADADWRIRRCLECEHDCFGYDALPDWEKCPTDHVEQVTAAEQLYGRQLTFRISHEELRSELNLLSEAYSPDILQRAECVLLEQKRKHSWLF